MSEVEWLDKVKKNFEFVEDQYQSLSGIAATYNQMYTDSLLYGQATITVTADNQQGVYYHIPTQIQPTRTVINTYGNISYYADGDNIYIRSEDGAYGSVQLSDGSMQSTNSVAWTAVV